MENALRESEKSISKANQLREDLRSTNLDPVGSSLDRVLATGCHRWIPLGCWEFMGIHGNSWELMGIHAFDIVSYS